MHYNNSNNFSSAFNTHNQHHSCFPSPLPQLPPPPPPPQPQAPPHNFFQQYQQQQQFHHHQLPPSPNSLRSSLILHSHHQQQNPPFFNLQQHNNCSPLPPASFPASSFTPSFPPCPPPPPPPPPQHPSFLSYPPCPQPLPPPPPPPAQLPAFPPCPPCPPCLPPCPPPPPPPPPASAPCHFSQHSIPVSPQQQHAQSVPICINAVVPQDPKNPAAGTMTYTINIHISPELLKHHRILLNIVLRPPKPGANNGCHASAQQHISPKAVVSSANYPPAVCSPAPTPLLHSSCPICSSVCRPY